MSMFSCRHADFSHVSPFGIRGYGQLVKMLAVFRRCAGVGRAETGGEMALAAEPAFIGNLVTVKACINMTGKTSMEIGARVETEDLLTGVTTHLASAYLTFVALDENKKPVQVPQLKIEAQEDIRRNNEAHARRKMRLSEKKKESECQKDISKC